MADNNDYYINSAATSLKGVGKKYADILQNQGILNLFDLLIDLPFRYLDETFITSARDAIPDGRFVLMHLKVRNSKTFQGGRTRLFKVILDDESGTVAAMFFNAYPIFTNNFKSGSSLLAFGSIKRDHSGIKCLQHPRVEFLHGQDLPKLKEHLTPVYHLSGGMPQKIIAKFIESVLCKLPSIPLPELLPKEFNPYGMDLGTAITSVHHPLSRKDHRLPIPEELTCFKRIAFEELTAYQLSMLNLRRLNLSRESLRIPFSPKLHDLLLKNLKFKLTNAQQKAFQEICADLQRHTPMLRLLHGDVGSGKTLVALMACLQVAAAGFQSVLLAPTELLAEQHYRKFSELLQPIGIKCALLTSSIKNAVRTKLLYDISRGDIKIIIGTHSVFQKDVTYHNLALSVIDEQHRFGIGQRIAMLAKAPEGKTMHQLVMTATPIPRTQQLALYADLDVSMLDELPSGRTPIVTAVISADRRCEVISRLQKACSQGIQAYWVCPRIEMSENEENDGIASVLKVHKELCQAMPKYKIALVHGQMSTAEKNAAMQEFSRGEASVLVATTIIEVGVDVPNASIIVIENADRLGLAQLHQLRGRVGRGSKSSYCLLLYGNSLGECSEIAMQRLKIMRSTTDGFAIAAADLSLRGPGEIFGEKQTGFSIFRIADSVRDAELIPKAHKAAEQIINNNETTSALINRWFSVTRQEKIS
ncbi:MAG TPA: ATP-dependent DNA helicase RecG [Succinivibrionaceae bacterium]|nr:ATP-dependent DNA helicase RecG [Succinivibrionaceae bacterium]